VMSAWAAYDAQQFIIQADAANSQMRLCFRNSTLGEAWTFGAWVAYDGAFTDTGFYQFLKAGGLNNMTLRNNIIDTKIWTDAGINGLVVA